MNAKITVIYDEGAQEYTNLIGAQGSSFRIDVDGETILFGVGRRGNYMKHNMGDLDLEASAVSCIIIADTNPDEWGAIDAVLREREKPVPVRAPASVWGEKRFIGSTGMYVSPEQFDKADRQDLVPGWSQISEHVFVGVFGNNVFQEAVLVLRTRDGPVVVSNRCMSGMKSIFEAVEDRFKRMPVAYVGGLDIGKKNDALCDAVANYLKDVGCADLHFNGCAKAVGINRLRTVLGLEGVKDFFVGDSLEYEL